MRKRNLFFYWLLIGIPAVVLTGTAIFSLYRIQAYQAEKDSRMQRIHSYLSAYSMIEWMQEHTDDLGKVLSTLQQEQITESLYEIRRTNVLVRNVFMWEKGKGIVLPRKDSQSTEDQLFLGRYQNFFPPDYIWGISENEHRSLPQEGCKRWTDANGLQFLIWRQINGQCVVGIEVEMVALLARLSLFDTLFPRFKEKDGSSYPVPYTSYPVGIALIDSRGPLMQEGDVPDENPIPPLIYVPTLPSYEIPLTSLCQTWIIKIYWPEPTTFVNDRSIMLIGGSLIFLLIASLFAGGYLFARDAARERRDALQKTTFVSNVSHELKTPLTNVRLYAELLADGHAKTPETQQQYLGIIVTESERLTRLINNVLDFGRLEQQRRSFHIETIELSAWLQATVHALRGITDDAEMTVTVSCPPDLHVRVDRDALSQVFLNVIDNACKYAKAGKVIDIRAYAIRPYLTLEISDRGPGIDAEHGQRIFLRFYRVDDSTTASVGGCGLGLSIAKQLMQGMGGDICWKPREGGGSSFLLTLERTKDLGLGT